MTNQKPTFEQAMAQLEQIVAEIEQGKVPLEQSIERYAAGMQLIKQCQAIIQRAEEKIQLLSRSEGDALVPDGELPDRDNAQPGSAPEESAE